MKADLAANKQRDSSTKAEALANGERIKQLTDQVRLPLSEQERAHRIRHFDGRKLYSCSHTKYSLQRVTAILHCMHVVSSLPPHMWSSVPSAYLCFR